MEICASLLIGKKYVSSHTLSSLTVSVTFPVQCERNFFECSVTHCTE
jgi:hypothetical protein